MKILDLQGKKHFINICGSSEILMPGSWSGGEASSPHDFPPKSRSMATPCRMGKLALVGARIMQGTLHMHAYILGFLV